MPWMENERPLFVFFKLGHKSDIVTSTISGWIRLIIMECYTQPNTTLLK